MSAPIDPIHQLIELHKTAVRACDRSWNSLEDALESIPGSMSFQSDHPRLTKAKGDNEDALERQYAVAVQLVTVEPTSIAGAAALLTYALEHVEAGHEWPIEMTEDRSLHEDERRWSHFLQRSVASTLHRLARG